MSNITNDNFGPAGSTATVAQVNNKFSDVATATASINEDNVRAEGVDRHTLQGSSSLIHSSYVANDGTSFVYPAMDGTDDVYLSHGGGLEINLVASPLSIETGDLIRIHFAVHLRKHTDSDFVPNLDDTHGPANVDTCGLALLLFPVWDTTGTLVFTDLPERATLTATKVAPSAISIDPAVSPAAYKTDGVAFYPLTGEDSPPDCNVFKTMHGSAVHIATAPFSIHRIRIHMRGPLNYQSDGATGANKELGVVDFTAGPWSSYISLPWDFTMERGHMALTVLRGGNV